MKKSTENSYHEVHEVKQRYFLRSFFSIYLVTFVYFVVGAVFAGTTKKDLTVADISKKVEEAQAAMQDAQMDLEMEMKDSLSGSQQKSKGAVKMKAPDKIYVHYTQPSDQFLYIGGSLTQMYQPDQKTVYQQHSGKGKDSSPVYLGVGKQLKKYIEISKVTLIKNSDSEVGLLFIPKNKITAGG